MIRVESKGLALLAARLSLASKNFKGDMRNAIKDAKRRIATDASRSAAAIYNVKAGDLTKRWQTSDPSADSFSILGSRRPLTAATYGAKLVTVNRESGKVVRVSTSANVAPGVSVKFLKTSRAKVIPGAWWPLRHPNPSIPWQRAGKARYPIRPVKGPSLADMLANTKVSVPLIETAQNRMAEQVNKRLQKAFERG